MRSPPQIDAADTPAADAAAAQAFEAAAAQRAATRAMDRVALQALQLKKLNRLLATVREAGGFYAQKLHATPGPLEGLDELPRLPLTTKDELLPPAAGDRFARNLTHGPAAYTRYHQTSGTRGRPMAVLDTAEDWRWWIGCWQHVLDAAGVTPEDRAVLAFSFGPFVGFWSAFDALAARGVMAIPGGGMSSRARIDLIEKLHASCLLCTPSYALHLAEVAAADGVPLAGLGVEKVIVAGEPGGSVPATRQRIERAWGAKVCDHAGATEVGAWGYGDPGGQGLRIIESEFLAEFLSVETGRPAGGGELSHLVLTTLGRHGSPVIRYRTGDLVRPRWPSPDGAAPGGGPGGDRSVLLEGGVLGRADDMVTIRGVNIFPSAVEQVLRGFPEVVDFRITARKRGEMDELIVEVEDHLGEPARVARELRLRLGLKIEVRLAPPMSLPRSEGKGHRFVDLRDAKPREGGGP